MDRPSLISGFPAGFIDADRLFTYPKVTCDRISDRIGLPGRSDHEMPSESRFGDENLAEIHLGISEGLFCVFSCR